MRASASLYAPPKKTNISRLLRITAASVATLATVFSAYISVLAGIARGGNHQEQLAWAALALVLLLGTHLLPAISCGRRRILKVIGSIIWLMCLICTCYGHATFFLYAQANAGAARAQKVSITNSGMSTPQSGARDLTAIASDQARVQGLIAAAIAATCRKSCKALTAHRKSLQAQIVALDIEASEARRRETAEDRTLAAQVTLTERRDQARQDPVTRHFAKIANIDIGSLDLGLALILGLTAELFACVTWAIAFDQDGDTVSLNEEHTITRSHVASKASHVGCKNLESLSGASYKDNLASSAATLASHGPELIANGDAAGSVRSPVFETSELHRLTAAIVSGAIKPTVKEIRHYMRCSQEKASQLRRDFKAIGSKGPQSLALADGFRANVRT